MSITSIVVACFNAVWQGIAIAALTAIALRFGRRVNAATACTVWSAAFVVIALLPALDLALQRSVIEKKPAETATIGHIVAGVAQPRHAHAAPEAQARADTAAPRTRWAAAAPAVRWNASAALNRIAASTSAFAQLVGSGILAVWALLALALVLKLARECRALVALKRASLPLERRALRDVPRCAAGRRVTVCTSDLVRVPCALGFLQPMVLVPALLAETLSDDDLLRVVLHEISHLQRLDDWWNALERLMRAVLFFQPALWYASARISFERELACDDRVLAATGEPLSYAECLTSIVERHVRHRRALVPVPGFLHGRNQVVGRIARLLDRRRNGSVAVPRHAGIATWALFAFAAVLIAPLQVPLLAVCRAPAVAESTHRLRVRHPIVVAIAPRRQAPQAEHACRGHAVTRSRASTLETIAFAAPARKSHARPTAGTVARAAIAVKARVPRPESTVATVVNAADVAVDEADRSVQSSNDLLDALAAAGLHPSVDELIKLRDSGVSVALLHAIAVSGMVKPSVDEVTAAADSGIDTQLLSAAVAAFGRSIPLHDVVRLRDAGVSAEYLGGLAALRSRGLSVDEAVALSDNGVPLSYIGAVAEAGYGGLGARELVELHDDGVDARFLQRLSEHGLRDLRVNKILRLHDDGAS